jgi:hypothetical protein
MRQPHIVVVLGGIVIALIISFGRDSRPTFAQEERASGTTTQAAVINGIPIPKLGKPVGGVLDFAGGDGNRQEIKPGPRGTFIYRMVAGTRGSIELSMQPENFVFSLRETLVPLFVPPGLTLRLSQAGDRVYWIGFDVP